MVFFIWQMKKKIYFLLTKVGIKQGSRLSVHLNITRFLSESFVKVKMHCKNDYFVLSCGLLFTVQLEGPLEEGVILCSSERAWVSTGRKGSVQYCYKFPTHLKVPVRVFSERDAGAQSGKHST